MTRTIDDATADRLGARLADAARDGTALDPSTLPDLTVADGYAIQRALLDRRTADPVGYKVGFTSPAIQDELGVDAPAYGRVLADTVRSEGRLDAAALIDPKLEPELALRLGEPLDPPVTPADVLAAADAVVPVIEVVDSRIEGWELTAGSAVADNALAAGVVHGDRIGDPADRDLSLEGVVVRRNGERVATGVGADVLGSPARVVSWLADALADRDERLSPGDLISTGSLTELIPFDPGDTVEVRFASLGSVTVSR
ncbi:2-keto-4-pentenoate hydratase [Haloplanus aerogenes]|uniref:2-oxo-3-hexenedioate decarboxylase/2-oxo-hept-3-ene-1,7-dioate hydratase/2-keto-4-pentenoate hydratase n=1 Tax=Haloplanus aerogenes TaxID=660522 RepID=A0A3M0D9B9_9EURY|nr:fumarylacetoacetate hydrolase family protein [Haloplanus aerogenes]AZH26483.1 2-oxopent-4-enoate hydratase [Haloplanus aerogenes]RMB18047.1 2-oxo-3-hexenedioate decarboxylase/2-oxo-hept-3-ene-1,7-dioate hydratase/2-keto-4-pentenoate hydratase [Haloplanus aerogenes]